MVERIKRRVLEEAREYGNRVGSIENQERIRYEFQYILIDYPEILKRKEESTL